MFSDHSSSTTTTTTSKTNRAVTTLDTIPRDIIYAHILSRFDALTLVSVGCVSTQLHSLCIDEDHWQKICRDTWPSVNDPRVHDAIATLSFGYRSLFSSSFSSFRSKSDSHRDLLAIPNELISAVDMHYMGRPVYSKVQVTSTLIEGFLREPTWVDMLNPKEKHETDLTEFGIAEVDFLTHVARNMTLSWIMIDPTHKLAANLSSLQPVLVEPHFLNGHVRIRYSTILTIDDSSETAEIRISVLCGIQKGGEVQVKQMNLVVLDMYGENMKWKDSLVSFREAMVSGRREIVKGRDIYEEYLRRVVERRREKEIAQVEGHKIVGILCLLFYLGALFPWVIFYFFTRYFLRRRERAELDKRREEKQRLEEERRNC